jgi:hypothetical protein
VSSPPDWITVDEVAAYLDLPGDPTLDDNLVLSTATVKAAVERRRSDLNVSDGLDPPTFTFTPGDEVHGGAVLWAAILYQARSSPSGYSGFGDETMIFDALGARRAEVMRLIGWRRPVAT